MKEVEGGGGGLLYEQCFFRCRLSDGDSRGGGGDGYSDGDGDGEEEVVIVNKVCM